eukprot:CAMPEP_0204316576 /NCGR_PEP_ID=MMETSP0469-20131031/5472_1 /ASSEMBLY_ACC=CAM_ASM_000384 /TAXON_ID=2969 /ORGANISM="Oxyrrhis marina" /LENGTH=321 /DNA_ID=CAMNT_0051297369 /DNA_START=44 /DNA_END=1009 /DNA_ORIENTATION=+
MSTAVLFGMASRFSDCPQSEESSPCNPCCRLDSCDTVGGSTRYSDSESECSPSSRMEALDTLGTLVFPELEVVNTFLHVGGERLQESRFCSAPAGLGADLLETMAKASSPVAAAAQLSWADLSIDEPAEQAVTAQGLVEKAQRIVIDHLRAELSGSMNLSTLGNRLPKSLIHALKLQGVRVADLVHSVRCVTVTEGLVQLVGGAAPAAKGRSYSRGEFLRTMRSGELLRSEAEQVITVLNSVYELVSESEDQRQSTFALGNWLAPGCRSFLKTYGVRLLEVLREFPEFFDCTCGTQAKPIVALVGAGVDRHLVCTRLCGQC